MSKSNVPLRQRKLHRGHFAFMRSVVQGLPLRESWERYVRLEGEHTDIRSVRSTIAWIRGEFAAAARREKRHGTARLVLLDAAMLTDAPDSLPSLEEFAHERGLEHFSEAEQLAAYEAKYGQATARQGRRERVIQRQLAALQWLESLVAEPPRNGDAIASWMHPLLTHKLEAAGLHTLGDLIERIDGVGRTWAKGIHGIGSVKAKRIVEWLRDHEACLGSAPRAHVDFRRTDLDVAVLDAVVEPATAIRPLEKFRPPAQLDGSAGIYRCPPERCLLKAENDFEAILVWLRAKPGLTPHQIATRRTKRRTPSSPSDNTPYAWLDTLSNTQRAYRKEAERFLLWAILVRGKALSSMALEDCIAYREFLADPQPKAEWCGHRAHERWSPLWRPFEGPLSPAAQRQTVVILKNLYGFLASQGYLMGNPWAGVTVPASSTPSINAGRSFTGRQWQFIEEQLRALPRDASAVRLTVALELLYATGLRLSEIVAAKAGDLRWVEYPPDSADDSPVEGWMLTVIGKGQRLREIPVPKSVVDSISRYFTRRGLDGDVSSAANIDAYLLGKSYDWDQRMPQLAAGRPTTQPGEGIAATTLARQLKEFFQRCGRRLIEAGDPRAAARLDKASTHWLRHTHASHAIAAGMPIEIAQQNLGHASLATTTIYVTTEKKRRLRANMQIFEGRRLGETED